MHMTTSCVVMAVSSEYIVNGLCTKFPGADMGLGMSYHAGPQQVTARLGFQARDRTFASWRGHLTIFSRIRSASGVGMNMYMFDRSNIGL